MTSSVAISLQFLYSYEILNPKTLSTKKIWEGEK